MTAEEVRKKYCIPLSVLQHYKTMEFYQKTHPFPRPYDPEDVKYLNKILSLKDAGFSHSEIDQYMCLSLDGASQENKLNFLHQKRVPFYLKFMFWNSKLTDWIIFAVRYKKILYLHHQNNIRKNFYGKTNSRPG